MEDDNEKYWFCGKLISGSELSLSIHDPGWKFGATVFTTLRVYEDSLEHPLTGWQWHCDRITQSLDAFHWSKPDWTQVRLGCQQLLPDYPVLRITIFPDGRELITGRQLPADLAQAQKQGVMAWVAEGPFFHRALPDHKTGNYLPSWLAMQAARQQGAREAILLNSDKHWLETSTGNLWGWAQGQWWTPPLNVGILPGIARTYLIEQLKKVGLAVKESPWTPDVVQNFEALAYSNCVVELLPVHTVLMGNTTLEYKTNHSGVKLLREQFAIPPAQS